MPRVDFYILPEQGVRERFTCDIASKIHRQQLELYIHTASKEEATALDDLLWTFKDISFLPHSLVGADNTDTITIGWEGMTASPRTVLINLSSEVPEFANDFERIVEIVPPEAAYKQQARQRYKQYREAGFELHNHEIDSTDVIN
jgi:DNA polymerase-3 subunit chi